MDWLGAALTPVAELTKPTFMLVAPAAAVEVVLAEPLVVAVVSVLATGAAVVVVAPPPQPARTIAAPIVTVSTNSATAIHLRLLIAPLSIGSLPTDRN